MNLEERIDDLPAGSVIMVKRRIFFVVRQGPYTRTLISEAGEAVRPYALDSKVRMSILFIPPTNVARAAIARQRKKFIREIFYKQLFGSEKRGKHQKPRKTPRRKTR